MNQEIELKQKIQQQAEQLMQEDSLWMRRKAVEAMSSGTVKEHLLADILMDVATLYDYPQERLYGSELLERLYQYAKLLNFCAKEEAMRYVRKEHELAAQMKMTFGIT